MAPANNLNPEAPPSTQARLSLDIYDAEEFGARADGKSDDVRAIQRAIDKAAVDGGGVVYLSPGTYRIDSTLTLKANVHLQGAGWGATHIDFSNAADSGNLFEALGTVSNGTAL